VPAVFLGHRGAEQAGGAGLGPDLAIDVGLFLPARVVGGDLLLHEAAGGVAEGGVVFVEQGARNREHGGFPGAGKPGMLPSKRLLDKQWGRDKNCPLAPGGQRP
jgi:hypothetical protein